jgi:hypothetical protein
MPRMIVLKTGRTIPSPVSPEATGTTPSLSGTLLFSPLFGASFRGVPILSKGYDCSVSKGKRRESLTNIGGADRYGKYALPLPGFVSKNKRSREEGEPVRAQPTSTLEGVNN